MPAGRPAGAAVGELEHERERIDAAAGWRQWSIAGAELRGGLAGRRAATRRARACRRAAASSRCGPVACRSAWLRHQRLRASGAASVQLGASSPRRLCSCQSLLVSCSLCSARVSVDPERDPGAAADLDHEVPAPGRRVVAARRLLQAGGSCQEISCRCSATLRSFVERQARHLLRGQRAADQHARALDQPERLSSARARPGSDSRSLIVCEHITTPTPHCRFRRVSCWCGRPSRGRRSAPATARRG